MPTIVFEGAGHIEKRLPAGERLVVEAPAGGALVDLIDQHSAPVPFSCRSASCATCRIEVLEGASLFEEAEDEELAILDVFGAGPSEQRLACQAKVKAAAGRIRLRAFNED